MQTQLPQVLLLSSADTPLNRDQNTSFIDALNNQHPDEMQVSWAHYDNLGFYFEQGAIKPFWVATGKEFGGYSAVVFKSYYRYVENALVLAEFFRWTNTKFVCSELRDGISFSKLSQYARLATANLPLPRTLYLPSVHLAGAYQTFVDRLGLPFIFKASGAKGGDANYLIKDENQYQEAVKSNPEIEFVAQEFIPNDSDLRVMILGNSIEMVIQRQRHDESTHLNNTSQGGSAVLLDPTELDNESQELSLKAAKLLKREFAGVDLMFAKDSGKPYILEINASPQVATGAFTEEKIEKYGNFLKNMLQ